MREVGRKHKEILLQMELLYKKHHRQLYLYALTFLEKEEEAEDVVNDTFEWVWHQWQEGEFRTETSAGYLYRLVRNKCLDILRHRKVHLRYAQMSMATESIVSDDEAFAFERRIVDLRNAVEQLPEPGRTILKNCYFRKLTYNQVAEEMQITVNVVHKNMVKMFQLLRKMLKNDE